MEYDPTRTTDAFSGAVFRQNGSLAFEEKEGFYPLRSQTYATPVKYPSGYKPFDISVYNYEEDRALLTLRLIVNPTDMQIGQVWLSNSSYTRKGWVNTLWGRQQSTISANGIAAAFYLANDGFRRAINSAGVPTVALQNETVNEGLVNGLRRTSIGFINLQTLAAFFRNNGVYFLNDPKEQDYFKSGNNRVPFVVDSMLISYDGSEFLGSFNTFTLDEAATNPYNMKYTFEYIISGIRGSVIEGHLGRKYFNGEKKVWNYDDARVIVSNQGAKDTVVDKILMSEKQLNADLRIDEKLIEKLEAAAKDFKYHREEEQVELAYWATGLNKDVSKLDKNTVVVSSTNLGRPGHDKKMDYRTSTGIIRALSEGEIVRISISDAFGGSNYVTVRTTLNGEEVYARYYHLDTSSLRNNGLNVGDKISVGTILGREGTDNGKYDPHCDLEVKRLNSGKYTKDNYNDNGVRVDATQLFVQGVNAMASKVSTNRPGEPVTSGAYSEYTNVVFRKAQEKFSGVTWDGKIKVTP